ncbi:hypothetical protein [Micrococcus sp. ACRRV]
MDELESLEAPGFWEGFGVGAAIGVGAAGAYWAVGAAVIAT